MIMLWGQILKIAKSRQSELFKKVSFIRAQKSRKKATRGQNLNLIKRIQITGQNEALNVNVYEKIF